MTYKKVKDYYDRKLWDITRVRNAVVMEVITPEQFLEITDEAY